MTSRPFLVLAASALALRVACALVTEVAPIFPAYYYTDARLSHEAAVAALRATEQGGQPIFEGPRAARVQVFLVYQLYRLAGPRPLVVKLVNALLGAVGIAFLAWLFSLAFSMRAAILSGILVAVWPSHVFYTSQNLKEAPANLLAYAGLSCLLAAVFSADASRPRRAVFAAGAVLAMIGVGFYRPPVLTALSAALLAALFFAVASTSGRRLQALAAVGMVAAALTLYSWMSRRADAYESQLIPATSVAKINSYRKDQVRVGRDMARHLGNRELGTSIYPDAEFKIWGDVLSYLPKAAFTVLFMPLPILYPMDGKIGRIAASGENLLLLIITALAVVGVVRGQKSPARVALLVFFLSLTVGAALFEIDLGSAGRHKLLYLPMLFPFAIEELLRWRA
jgi:hypothetical protein